jgi:PAS domain-containing protein
MTDVQSYAATARSYDLLDALPNPIYVWRLMPDGDVYLAYANAAGYRETEGHVGPLIGSELRALYGETDPDIVDLILQTLADGEPRRIEHPYRFSTGRVRWFRTSYMRTTADEVVVENEDLTERRRHLGEIEAAERRVRRERTRLAELLDSAPALICTFRGPNHVDEIANEECRRFLGRDDVIGLTCADVMPELVRLLSNETQVTPQTPPTFLVHTVDDRTVPVENSLLFYRALRAAGVSAEMHIYEHGPHGFGLATNNPVLSSWTMLCENWMRMHGWLGAAKSAAK